MLHDWSAPVVETLQWRTRVSESRGLAKFGQPVDEAFEARAIVAPVPSRSITTSEWVDVAREAQYAQGALTQLIGYRPGAVRVTSTGSASNFPLDNASYRGFEVGRECLFVHADGSTSAPQITNITQFNLHFAQTVSWQAGDTLMPAFWARRSGALSYQWRSPTVRIAQESWEFVSPARWDDTLVGSVDDLSPAWDPVVTFAGHEVVSHRTVEAATFVRQEERMHGEGGAWDARTPQPPGHWKDSLTRTYVLYGRQAIWSFRRMLYRRMGRYRGAFVPTGRSLPYLGTRSYLGSTYVALSDSVLPMLHGAVAVWFRGGGQAFMWSDYEDSTSTALPVEQGEIWLSTPLSSSDEIESVDWLMYARLDSDAVSITYGSTEVATVSLGWVQTNRPGDAEVAGPTSMRIDMLLTSIDQYEAPVLDFDIHGANLYHGAMRLRAGIEYVAPPVEIDLHGANLHHAPLRLRASVEPFP